MASPYTRTTWVENYAWNEIIQEVNNLATNPDEGCDPLETLEEVKENHIWTKKNITEVQDKLKEICPDNEFTELKELWTSIIVTEIVEAIDLGWCDCRPILEEWPLGQWIVVKMYGDRFSPSGSQYNKCGGRTYLTGWSHFTGQDEYKYPSPCYDMNQYDESGAELWQIVQDSYQEAYTKTASWVMNRRIELQEQQKVEDYSTQLRSKKEVLINLQNQLAACQSDCGSIETQIEEIEEDIMELENQIQTAKDKRDEHKSKAEEDLVAADAAATGNWTSLASMQYWDPTAFNIVDSHIGEISLPWGLNRPPYIDYRWSSWGVGGTWTYAIIPDFPQTINMMTGRFTPSGLPFSKRYPIIFGSEYFYRKVKRHQCGWWESTLGICEFEEWGEETTVEYKSILGWTRREGDILELKYGQTKGTKKVEEYNPDPDQ